ncbi:hypothetical protein EGW08_018306 [Elysia chlorotica]|uniref:PH domain-containing protein n=1 Tax=Elysia chlorotica TaxID=188477 RepID=A0A433SX96_ELYCH|nr:hypothetical protein EGW08_018306 [Elysia chlorotica]
MMDDVKPTVRALWRLLRILEEDEGEVDGDVDGEEEGEVGGEGGTGKKQKSDCDENITAYISPRSPHSVSNKNHDKTQNVDECSVGNDTSTTANRNNNRNKNSNKNNNNEVDSKRNIISHGQPHDRCIISETDASHAPLCDKSRDPSDGKSSPTSDVTPCERGRGRSRERHVVRNNCEQQSPDTRMRRAKEMVISGKMGGGGEISDKGDQRDHLGHAGKTIGGVEVYGDQRNQHIQTAGKKSSPSPTRIISRRRPSPKRSSAPRPPSPRSCPSPAPKPVSTSDVSPADVEGWLVDQLRGRRVWAVLSDMLFCVFERPDAETSKQVLLLPGCSVRVLEFKSAHLHLDKRRQLIREARLDSASSCSSHSNVVSDKDNNNNKHDKESSLCNGNSVANEEGKRTTESNIGVSPRIPINVNGSVKGSNSSTSSYPSVDESRTRGSSITSDGSNSSSSNNSSIPSSSKTVSGVDRFQFVIENSITRQKHMFAVPSRVELDLWTSALDKACSLDIALKDSSVRQEDTRTNLTPRKGKTVGVEDIILSDRSESLVPNGSAKNGISPRSKVKTGEDSISPTYTPRQMLPSRIDVHSLSMSLTSPHDVSKETVDEIRRKLKKDYQNTDSVESKPIPLKATHQLDESVIHSATIDSSNSKSTSKNGESPRKGRHFFKGRSPLDVLLGRKKRSSSADDAYNRNRKMFPVYKRSEDSLSNPSFSPRQAGSTGSQQSLESSLSSQSQAGQHDSSFSASSADSRDSPGRKQSGTRSGKHRGGPLARSWDPDLKTSRGFGASIRRTASDLKERVFGASNISLTSSKTSEASNGRSKPPGLKLKDLTDARVKGHLQYRVAFKFVKVFCVLSKGCFYAFKSEKPEEVPLLAMVLSPCSVTYVVESELEMHRKKSKQKQNQRIFAFKLSQPHCKSIYACADNHQTLMQWVMAIQGEACRVQVDEELAAEIREKPSSLKKKQEKELSLQASVEPSSLSKKKLLKQMEHRLSCPTFDGPGLSLSRSGHLYGPRDETLNGLITPRRVSELSSKNLQIRQSKDKDQRFVEKFSSALYRSKSDKDIDLVTRCVESNENLNQKPETLRNTSHTSKPSKPGIHGVAGLDTTRKHESLSNSTGVPTIQGTGIHNSSLSHYHFKKTSSKSNIRTGIKDNGACNDVKFITDQNLRLDLSGLVDDNNDEEVQNATPSSERSLLQTHSYRDDYISRVDHTEDSSQLTTSSTKLPWKPNVKRTSSLNSAPFKSISRSSFLRSSLLPSKSSISDDFNVKSSSALNSNKQQTQSPNFTSFFSTSDFDTQRGYSSNSNFPGNKENAHQEDSSYEIQGATEFESEDWSPNDDIISPPPLFRSSDKGGADFDESHQSAASNSKLPSPEGQPLLDPEVERPRHLPFPSATDPALREAWSRDEDYLLGVVRDKLRRRQRDPDPWNGELHSTEQVIIQVRS